MAESSPQKAMGRAEKSSDWAHSNGVGFKRRYPRGTGPSGIHGEQARLGCFCIVLTPESSEAVL